MRQKDLFGNLVPYPEPEVKGKKKRTEVPKVNPLIRYEGPGPDGKRCKHCSFFYRKRFAKTYFKCELRGDTNGPGTDHRANWKACGKFKPKNKNSNE